MTRKLSPAQAGLIAFMKPGQRYYISRYWLRTAAALQRKGIIRCTDCGMSTADGSPVLIVELTR